MLHFFRHIRHSFLLPGKVRTYLAYAFGEIVLIVVGIMIALQISNLNQERKDRSEEVVILSRIVNELNRCISDVTLWSEGVLEKEKALHNLNAAFGGKPVTDQVAFLRDLPISSDMGWTQPGLPQSTYLEMVSSGKLRLIRNIQLREEINDYYEELVEWHKRGNTRVNEDFTKTIYSLIPFERGVGNNDNILDTNLSDGKSAALVKAVLNSDLKQHIAYELNRAGFLWRMYQTTLEDATELKANIQAELAH